MVSPREGVIIECPLNEIFKDVVTVIITSQMVVSKNLVTFKISQNVGTFIIFFHFLFVRR